MNGARMDSTERLMCELTIRDGKVVYDLNGMSRPDWDSLPKDYGADRRCAMGRLEPGRTR